MASENKLRDILGNHGLRKTDCRLDVLAFFMNQKNALSQSILENHLKQYDRVTLYRTLNSFLEAGIIHKIPNSQGIATYGLCYKTCSPDDHEHNHVHFKCNQCGQILCLDEKAVPEITVPAGFMIESVNMIVDGVCDSCN